MPKDIQAVASLAWSWATWAAAIAIGILVMAAIAQTFGFRAPYVPTIDPARLAYLCGCFYLWRKA